MPKYEKGEKSMRCRQHRRYKAKLRPRIDCVDCWRIYLSQTATYNDVCQEIDRRLPKDEPGISYAIDFEPTPIMDLLIEAKKELETKYFGFFMPIDKK